jgi:hypothetical protein
MRLAILGNSHLGSLKRAWDKISSEFPSLEIVFFGARGNTLENMRSQGRKLVPTTPEAVAALKFTSGGRSEIDLDGYDAVLIYGCSAQPFFTPKRNYSKQAIFRTMSDLSSGFHFRLLQMARSAAADLPIYLGHDPLLAAEPSPQGQGNDAYLDGMALLNQTILEPVGARMIGQPLDTIVNGNRTHIKYARGSKRLAIGDHVDDELHPERDIFHMNDEFGELWLRAFFAQLNVASSTNARARPDLETLAR